MTTLLYLIYFKKNANLFFELNKIFYNITNYFKIKINKKLKILIRLFKKNKDLILKLNKILGNFNNYLKIKINKKPKIFIILSKKKNYKLNYKIKQKNKK